MKRYLQYVLCGLAGCVVAGPLRYSRLGEALGAVSFIVLAGGLVGIAWLLLKRARTRTRIDG